MARFGQAELNRSSRRRAGLTFVWRLNVDRPVPVILRRSQDVRDPYQPPRDPVKRARKPRWTLAWDCGRFVITTTRRRRRWTGRGVGVGGEGGVVVSGADGGEPVDARAGGRLDAEAGVAGHPRKGGRASSAQRRTRGSGDTVTVAVCDGCGRWTLSSGAVPTNHSKPG